MPPMSTRSHWEHVFTSKAPTDVSWYQPRPAVSLDFIAASGVGPNARILDVGGGASTLVDSLLERGFSDVTVLDIAEAGLDRAKARLGPLARRARWLLADITTFEPTDRWDLWHDRAAFHFLVDASARAGYRRALRAGLAPGGHFVIATFGPHGPTKCSGLDVCRYGPDALAAELGVEFALQESRVERHRTPAGAVQEFIYCRLRRH